MHFLNENVESVVVIECGKSGQEPNESEMSNEKANPIEESLVKTLKESDLSAVTTDLADKIAEGLIGIPVVGTILGLYKTAGTVSDYLFTKKLLRFLTELKDIPLGRQFEMSCGRMNSNSRDDQWRWQLSQYLDSEDYRADSGTSPG